MELTVPGGDGTHGAAHGWRQWGAPHLQNKLSPPLSIWKKQVLEGSSGQGAAAPVRRAARNRAPSGLILPCGEQGTARVRAVTQCCPPQQPQHPRHHDAAQPHQKPAPGRAHPSLHIHPIPPQLHIINPDNDTDKPCSLLLLRSGNMGPPAGLQQDPPISEEPFLLTYKDGTRDTHIGQQQTSYSHHSHHCDAALQAQATPRGKRAPAPCCSSQDSDEMGKMKTWHQGWSWSNQDHFQWMHNQTPISIPDPQHSICMGTAPGSN